MFSKRTAWIIIIAISLLVLVFLANLVWGKTIKMAQGNRLFAAAETKKAQEIYEDLAVDFPNSPRVFHNLALCDYQNSKFNTAIEGLEKTAKQLESMPDNQKKSLLNRFYYHLGNAFFKSAESAGTGGQPEADPSKVKKHYLKALQSFKKAIENDPNDLTAKYNYELAKLRLNQDQEQTQAPPPKNQPEPTPPPPMDQQKAEDLLKMLEDSIQYQPPPVRTKKPSAKDW